MGVRVIGGGGGGGGGGGRGRPGGCSCQGGATGSWRGSWSFILLGTRLLTACLSDSSCAP